MVDGEERSLRPGDTLEVPRGAVHKMWNSGDGVTRATWQTRRPAGRSSGARRWTASAAATRPAAPASPSPTRLAALLSEYDDVIRLAAGPQAARRRGAVRAGGRRPPAGRPSARPRRPPALPPGRLPAGSWVSWFAKYTGMIEITITSRPTTFTIGSWFGPRVVAEDPDRQRLLRPRGERGHDDLVEREREREQRARHERRAQRRQRDVAEGLPAVGAEVLGRLLERRARASETRDRVVVDHDDAEGGVTHDHREQGQVHVQHLREGRVQRHAGDDAGQRERQDHDERDRLAAEEAVARHGQRCAACRAPARSPSRRGRP